MIIDTEKTSGCDNLSQAYRDAFNKIQPLLEDNDKIKQMDELDLSALALYLGKFAEQEINSSIVQLMRQICGVEMPTFYCKLSHNKDINADILTSSSRIIRLNEHIPKPGANSEALKTIPLGDAYYAFDALTKRENLKEDKTFFYKYRWLFERRFLDTWRNIGMFRNQAAHTGVIFTREKLEENINLFSIFMEYMPKMVDLKKELAPEGYVDELIIDRIKKPEDNIMEEDNKQKKPRASKEIAERYLYIDALLRKGGLTDSEEGAALTEINNLVEKYDFSSIIFEGENGKRGMRDALGRTIVPAVYDDFVEIYEFFVFRQHAIAAIRDGKCCLVKTDGSGEEIVPPIYDILYPDIRGYFFKKDGSTAWGFMNLAGKECVDCIIDNYVDDASSLYFKSGNYWGLWQNGYLAAPIIYDNIEMIDPDEPLLFTLNGVTGYVRIEDDKFVPKSEIDAIEDEDDRTEAMYDFLKDQYID